MLTPTKEETDARARGDWRGALKAFVQHQAEFHLESNTAKNASLYVDFKDSKFVTPGERITEAQVSDIAEKNSSFLRLMYPKVNMLLGWQGRADNLADTFAWFATRAEELRCEMPGDPERAFATLMQEMLERAATDRKEKRSLGDA